MQKVTMTQEEFNNVLIYHNLRGYVRGVKEIAKQLRHVADSLEKSCQVIERDWNIKSEEGKGETEQ